MKCRFFHATILLFICESSLVCLHKLVSRGILNSMFTPSLALVNEAALSSNLKIFMIGFRVVCDNRIYLELLEFHPIVIVSWKVKMLISKCACCLTNLLKGFLVHIRCCRSACLQQISCFVSCESSVHAVRYSCSAIAIVSIMYVWDALNLEWSHSCLYFLVWSCLLCL